MRRRRLLSEVTRTKILFQENIALIAKEVMM